jgi:serine/threonine-protein kinase
MSPEQLASQPVDGRADLFAVGVVLYELLGGAVPFDGEHMASIAYKILYETPVPLQTLNPDVPPALADVVMRCLAKAPDARYPDAAAAGAAWAASQRAAEARPPATPPQPARHLPMRLLGLGAALLLAVAGLLVLRPSVPAPSLAAAAPASQHPAAPLPTTADGSTAAENSKSSVTPVRDTSLPARRPEAVTQHAPVPRQKAQRSPDAAGNESKPLVAHKSQDESRKPGSFWQRHWGCLRKGDCPPPRKPPPRDR